QRNGLGSSTAIDKSTAAYRQDMDRVAGFFAEYCVFEPDAKVQTSALRKAYEDWCKEQGIRFPLGGNEFAKRLQERGCENGKSDGKRVWKGVRMLEAWEEPQQGQGRRDAGAGDSPKVYTREFTQTLPGNADPGRPCGPPPTLFDDTDERAAIQGEGQE
ncbi:MAG TPA: primase-like DNA-binding domain-containing protein, partial [Polyangiaceae bacterium]